MGWGDDDTGCIETPFDIEAILLACPALMEAWKRKPFYLDLDENGNVAAKPIPIEGE